ncbi:SpaA isopeptide-forming pilin-related protein [Pseudobutyrivibrio sp. LB2011]|uniref:SpaA isopeptide-forming pilin-related protein n=1 Tax=Pseudobutyrivibrio sp. LB2011 TaxID=1408312 RepID=UPI0005D22820|nr:SpaA isopeptide-forming pilin-related protein [Pseudobutyrivibrio sp. LB2011]
MKKNRLLNRTLSFGLALALFISSPASVYAGEMNDASVETIVENIDQGGASDEGESSGSDSTTASEETNSETGSESKDSDQVSSDASTSENDSNSDEQVNKGETPESSDTTADDAEADADKKADAEADANADKDTEDDDEEITYDYESNNDGTHVKKWDDKDGVAHEETEDCEFGEDGKCVHCGYEKEEEEDDEEITLQDEDGLVTITAKKSVLNGAKDVKVEEITVETDEDQYNEMSDALDKTTDTETSVIDFIAYDIKLFNKDGDEVEPKGEVNVVFNNLSVDGLDVEEYTTEVYHYEDSENVDKMENVTPTDDGSTVEMVTDHFSTYIIAVKGVDGALASQYANVYSVYYNEGASNKWPYTEWHSRNDLPTVVQDGSSYKVGQNDKYYIASVRVYINGSVVEKRDYAYTTDSAKQYFYVYPKSGYSLAGFAAGYGTDSSAATRINDTVNGHYYYELQNYCTDNNCYNTDHKKINYINIYLTGEYDSQFKVDLFRYNDSLVFFNNSTSAINYASYLNKKWVSRTTYRYLEMNTGQGSDAWNKDHSGPSYAYQGIADSTLDSNGMITFSNYGAPEYFNVDNKQNDTDYHTYTYYVPNTRQWYNEAYYNVGFPFNYENGYYVFDSSTTATTFDAKTGIVKAESTTGGQFWPFKKDTDSSSDVSAYDHFGMHFTQKFDMTKTGTNNSNPCIFEFSGDDDVWVYIDNKLVLDLGGIHGKVSGTIDFSTGECTISGVYPYKQNVTYNMYSGESNSKNIFTKSDILNNGEHTLQVYYLERGSGQSNCMIKFNLPVKDDTAEPVNPLDFTKVDADTSATVEGAKFTLKSSDGVYTALDDDGNEIVVSDANGKVAFTQLKDSNGTITPGIKQGTYILKEVDAKSGYELPTEDWYVLVQADGNGGSVFTIEGTDVDKTDAGYVIKNHKGASPTTTVFTEKTATVSNWESRVYEIALGASATTVTSGTKQDIVLVLDTSGSMGDEVTITTTTTYSKADIESDSSLWGISFKVEDTYYYYNEQYRVWCYYKNGWQYAYYTTDVPDSFTITTTATTTRLQLMKDAAKDFVSSLEGTGCRVAIVSFDYDADKVLGLTECTSANISTINRKIDGLQADGATRIDLGLEKVIEEIFTGNSRTDSYKNNIILFTDGVPTTYKDFDDTVASSAKGVADALKAGTNVSMSWDSYSYDYNRDAGSTTKKTASGCAANIYFIKYDNGSPTTKMTNFANYVAGSEDRVHSVSDMSKVTTAFQQVIGDIYQGAIGTVVDVIDPRFELVYKEGNQYKTYANGSTITASIRNASGERQDVNGTISVDQNGNQVITWNDIYIGYKLSDSNGFDSRFLVKAKDDFMGGNVIPTNGPASRVIVGDATKNFPMPTVNVKLLGYSLADNETTILLNDAFDVSKLSSDEEILAFLSGIECEYTDEFNTKHTSTNVFTNSSLAVTTDTSGNKVITYSYPGTSDGVGALTIEDAEKVGPEGNATTGDNLYYYETAVKYTAIKQTDRTLGSMIAPDTTNNEVTEYTGTGKYYVNVVDAGIYFDKVGGVGLTKLAGAKYGLYSDKECTKKIMDMDSSDGSQYKPLLVDGLGIGTYYVKEISAPNQFALSNEVFKIEINKVESAVGTYIMKISSDGDSISETVSKTFSVLGETVDKGYYFDATDKAIVKNDTCYRLKDYTVIVGTEQEKVLFSAIDKVAYTLPETGGSGVYVYTIGGILLMIAGALLLYKNKNNKSK